MSKGKKPQPRVRRCEGTRVREVRGQNQNAPCGEPATTTRSMNPDAPDGGTVLHYCDRCAADWDSQRALINSLI